MAKDIIMPALGMAQETGVLLEWLKSEGDSVDKGEPLMEVETDKATMTVEAPISGILANVTASAGDEIPVGEVIALILAPGEAAPIPVVKEEEPAPKSVAQQAPANLRVSPVAQRMAATYNVDLNQISKPDGTRIQKEDVLAYINAQEQSAASDGRVLASPKARRLAKEYDLDLARLRGSGPEGAVLAADVETAAEAAKTVAAETVAAATTVADSTSAPSSEATTAQMPISKMWRVMARRLTESWQTVPHFYLSRQANAAQLRAWRQNALQRHEVRITVTDLLVKLIATALRKHPRVNASWREGDIIRNEQINVGLAVAVEEGLLVPVIHQADKLGLQEIAKRRKEVVDRALAGNSTVTDLADGTFTISNLGMFGIDSFSAIVNPPQAAILAVGRIAEQIVPLDGKPSVQSIIALNLSCDHRVVDGARGARFLQTVVNYIEEPLRMLD